MFFNIICAVDLSFGIGIYENGNYKLPWKNNTDMKFFKNKTCYTENPNKMNAIIMGKNTFKSINYKTLINRINIIITKDNYKNEDEQLFFKNFEDSLNYCKNNIKIENIYVIGGAELINSITEHPKLNYIYLNQIQDNYNCNIIIKPLLENKNLLN